MESLNNILANKIALKKYNFPAVYFLIRKDKIIYIGSTLNFNSRLANHKNNRRMKFDSFYFIKYKTEETLKMEFEEALYIRKFKPKFNVRFNPDANKVERICFFKYLKTYDTLDSFSKKINLSTCILNKFFNSDPKILEKYTDIIVNHLFPNGINFSYNVDEELNLSTFRPQNKRPYIIRNHKNGEIIKVGSLDVDI